MTTPTATANPNTENETETQFDNEIAEINAQLGEIANSSSLSSLEERFEALLGAVQNYVVPMFESLRSEMHTGFSYMEAQINSPDPSDIIKTGQEAVGALLVLSVELLKDRGWYDEATGLTNDQTPEKLKSVASVALASAKKFQETVVAYEALVEEAEDEDEDDYEDDDAEGAE